MNEFENKSGTEGTYAPEGLEEQLQSLRMLLAITLVMLIGLTICADVFFWKQIQMLNMETQQMQRIIAGFPVERANDFAKRMRDYVKTHPDFAPIAARYPGVFNQGPAAPKK
jgi:hypothetical protein